MNNLERKLLCYVAMVVARMYSHQISKINLKGIRKEEHQHLVKLVEILEEVNPKCGEIAKRWAVGQSPDFQLEKYARHFGKILRKTEKESKWEHTGKVKVGTNDGSEGNKTRSGDHRRRPEDEESP